MLVFSVRLRYHHFREQFLELQWLWTRCVIRAKPPVLTLRKSPHLWNALLSFPWGPPDSNTTSGPLTTAVATVVSWDVDVNSWHRGTGMLWTTRGNEDVPYVLIFRIMFCKNQQSAEDSVQCATCGPGGPEALQWSAFELWAEENREDKYPLSLQFPSVI